jgi:hypothetical protein
MTTDIELANIEKEQTRMDRILRGDPEEKLSGLIAELHQAQNEINKFNRAFDKDYLGHGGLVSFITYLHDQEKARDLQSGYRWGFLNTATITIGSVLCAILALAGTIFLNWDSIQEKLLLRRHVREAAAVERTTKKLKADRAKARKLRAAAQAKVRPEPTPAPVDDGVQQ